MNFQSISLFLEFLLIGQILIVPNRYLTGDTNMWRHRPGHLPRRFDQVKQSMDPDPADGELPVRRRASVMPFQGSQETVTGDFVRGLDEEPHGGVSDTRWPPELLR
jgi:hypothetical protein